MDSSSLVKLYVRYETGVPETRAAAEAADGIATSIVAYAETRATLARVRRERRITSRAYARMIEEVRLDWPLLLIIDLSPEVVSQAGDLAEKHSLSGFDAIHLASLLALRNLQPDIITVSTWDTALARASTAEGLSLAHEVTT